MANETDLWNAIVEIVEADSTTVGIPGLLAKAHPLVNWGSRGMNQRPIIAAYTAVMTPRRSSRDQLVVQTTFDVFVDDDSTGLAAKVGDRLEAILTNPVLNSTSTARSCTVDAAPQAAPARRYQPDLDEGRTRLTLDFEFRLNRA